MRTNCNVKKPLIAAAAMAAVLAVLLILAGLRLPHTAVNAEEVLTEASCEFAFPQAGDTWSHSVYAVSAEPEKYYSVYPIYADCYGDEYPDGYVFKAGDFVTFVVDITAKPGYRLPDPSDTLTVWINGVSSEYYGAPGDGYDNGNYEIHYIVPGGSDTLPMILNESLEYGALREGYSSLPMNRALPLTIRTGTAPVTFPNYCINYELKGKDAAAFYIVNLGGKNNYNETNTEYQYKYTVLPVDGLAPGKYSAVFEIDYDPTGTGLYMAPLKELPVSLEVAAASMIQCTGWWGTSSSDHISSVKLNGQPLPIKAAVFFTAGETVNITVESDGSHAITGAYTLSNGDYGSFKFTENNGVYSGSFTVPDADFAIGINTEPLSTFHVVFDPNGGTGNTYETDVDNLLLLPKCPYVAPEGMVFERWSLGEPGETVVIEADTTVTAVWKAAESNTRPLKGWWDSTGDNVKTVTVDDVPLTEPLELEPGSVHTLRIYPAEGKMPQFASEYYAEAAQEKIELTVSSEGFWYGTFTMPNAELLIRIDSVNAAPTFRSHRIELTAVEGYSASELIPNVGLYLNGLSFDTENNFVNVTIDGTNADSKDVFTPAAIGGGFVSGFGMFDLRFTVKTGLKAGVYSADMSLYYDSTGSGNFSYIADTCEIVLTVTEAAVVTDAPTDVPTETATAAPTEMPTDPPATDIPATAAPTDAGTDVPAPTATEANAVNNATAAPTPADNTNKEPKNAGATAAIIILSVALAAAAAVIAVLLIRAKKKKAES